MQTEAVENYLKTIFEIQQEGGRVKTSELAKRLAVTAGSVTDMIKRLSGMRPKLVRHEPHRGVVLTASGKKAALKVIRRHRLIETFLNKVLGFSWDEVHQEAEKLEHHISERLTEAIAEYLNHPDYDPHGDPIPPKGGKLKVDHRQSLSTTPVGETVQVARVRHHDSEMLRYLDQVGINLNTLVTVIEKAPFKGPITVRIGPQRVAPLKTIGLNIAEDILVNLIDKN